MPIADIDWEIFSNFGLAGLTLGVFFIILLSVLWINSIAMRSIVSDHKDAIKSIVERMSTDHRESNEAWRSTFADYSRQSDLRQAETNSVLRDLSKVMSKGDYIRDDDRAKKNFL